MTHNHCHQSCKGERRTQHHSHTKLGTFRSPTKALLLTRQSITFYSNLVMAADLGWNHFLWAGTLIMFFQMKFKFSKKFWTVGDFTQNFSFFYLDCYAFPIKVCILHQLQLQCSPYQEIKGLLECLYFYRLARFLMLQKYHISMF